MKYCPTCGTRFDEEIMRFCTKDGTPLIDEEKPNFSTIPSEAVPVEADEADEVTVVRRNIHVPLPPSDDEEDFSGPARPSERIVIPTVDDRPRERVRMAAAYNPPPRPSTFKVVVLTILGTLAVLGMGGLAFLFLQKDSGPSNKNSLNANQNINTNVNAFDANFNFNGFTSSPPNNVNANLNTPTPTPTPKPSTSPSETPTATPTPEQSSTPTPEHSVTPTPSPSPGGTVSPSPRSTLSPDERPRVTPSPATTVPTPRPTPRVVISPSNRPD